MRAQGSTLAALLAALLLLPPAAGGEEPARGEVTLTLSEALLTSLANSPEVANAAIAAEISEKDRQIADRERLPEVSLDGGYTRLSVPEVSDIPIPGFSIPDEESDVAVAGSMPLYTGGRLASRREQASQGADLARIAEKITRDDTLLETASAFYELLAGQIFVDIAAESLESSNGHLRDVQALLEQGLVARVDLFRTELDVAERERDLASAEANLVRRSEHLSSLLFPDEIIPVKAAWDAPEPREPQPVAEWVEIAGEKSPELMASRLSLDLSQTAVASARAERRPAFGLFGRYGSKEERFSFGEEDRYWNAGLAFTLPLYAGGRILLEIDKSLDAERQAVNSLRRTSRNVRRFIVDSHSGAVLAVRRNAAAEKAVASAEENLRVTRLKYNQGLIANTDVIDALLSLSRARFDRIQARKEYHINHARLMRLAGTIEELP